MREEKKKGQWITQQFCEKHTPDDFVKKREVLLEKDREILKYVTFTTTLPSDLQTK